KEGLDGIEGALPLQFTVHGVAEQAVGAEVDIDVHAVGRGGGGGRRGNLVHVFDFLRGSGLTPQDFASATFEANGFEFLVLFVKAGDENPVVPNTGGRVAARQRGFPDEMVLRSKGGRETQSVTASALSMRPSELRPACLMVLGVVCPKRRIRDMESDGQE